MCQGCASGEYDETAIQQILSIGLVPYSRKMLIHKVFHGVPKTFGEQIIRRRLEDGLTQRELGQRFGVDGYTVMNWEKGRTKSVPARLMPVLIAYLGYNPEPEPETVGARLRWKRRSLGWTTAEAARRDSVDQSTWEAWERQDSWPAYPRFHEFLKEFLDLCADQLISRIRRVRPPYRG